MSIIFYNLIGTILEMFIKILYCHRLSEDKRYCVKDVLIFISLFVLHTLVLELDSSYANLLMTFISVVVMLIFVYGKKPKWALLLALMFPVIIYVADIITTVILEAIIDKSYGAVPDDTMGYFMGMAMSDTILLVSILYVSAVFKGRFEYLKARYWAFVVLCPIVSCIILIAFDILLINAHGIDGSVVFIPLLGLAYLNFMVCDFLETYSENVNLNIQKRLSQQNVENYKLIEASEKEYRMLRHDMQRHINVMREMLSQNQTIQTREYLDNMENTVSKSFYVYTGNQTIDAVINIETRKAKEHGIKVYTKIVNAQSIKVNSMDICTILSNAIENAIECCIKTGGDFVSVTVISTDEIVKIEIKNPSPYEPEIIRDSGFLTSKSDKTMHGYGMKNIEKIVKKYNGNIEKIYRNNIFYLYIIIDNMSFAKK